MKTSEKFRVQKWKTGLNKAISVTVYKKVLDTVTLLSTLTHSPILSIDTLSHVFTSNKFWILIQCFHY